MKVDGHVATRRLDFLEIDSMSNRAWLWWKSNVAAPNPMPSRLAINHWDEYCNWLEENYGVTDAALTPTMPLWEITDPQKYSMFLLRWS